MTRYLGPHLLLRRSAQKSQWIIRDRDRYLSTGCAEAQKPEAERVLARFIEEGGIKRHFAPGPLRARATRLGISAETIAVVCNIDLREVEDILSDLVPTPLGVSVLLGLCGYVKKEYRQKIFAETDGYLKADKEPENSVIWKDIPGSSMYQVSNTGMVRRVRRSDGTPAGNILRLKLSMHGHVTATIYTDDGRQLGTGVHRLMALAFHGLPPEGRPLACHHNGIPWENTPENVYWGSHQDNADDRKRHDLEAAAANACSVSEGRALRRDKRFGKGARPKKVRPRGECLDFTDAARVLA